MISGKMLIDCMTIYEKANRLYDKYTQAEIPKKKKKRERENTQAETVTITFVKFVFTHACERVR